MDERAVQDIEIDLFIEALRRRHGYDFSGYARASFVRRVRALQVASGRATISDLTRDLLHGRLAAAEVVARLAVPVSEMFRAPETFALLLREVLPLLASYPQINVWIAACAHGQEAYSLAILLKEQGLYERSRLYATDISQDALAQAREGIYPLGEARLYSDNYLRAGGRGSLSDWYTARYNHIKLDESLKARLTFVEHNLVADGVLGEMHLIFCRNTLIYFGDALQQRVIGLFRDSLVRGGYLVLGDREHPLGSRFATDFRALEPGQPVYRRQRVST